MNIFRLTSRVGLAITIYQHRHKIKPVARAIMNMVEDKLGSDNASSASKTDAATEGDTPQR